MNIANIDYNLRCQRSFHSYIDEIIILNTVIDAYYQSKIYQASSNPFQIYTSIHLYKVIVLT